MKLVIKATLNAVTYISPAICIYLFIFDRFRPDSALPPLRWAALVLSPRSSAQPARLQGHAWTPFSEVTDILSPLTVSFPSDGGEDVSLTSCCHTHRQEMSNLLYAADISASSELQAALIPIRCLAVWYEFSVHKCE